MPYLRLVSVEEATGALKLERPAVHDVIQVVSYFNYINRVADGVGVDDEPDWTT